MVPHKRVKNKIHQILDEDRNILIEEEDIGKYVVSFFSKLLAAESVLIDESILSTIDQVLSQEDNSFLVATSSMHEPKEAVFSMPSDLAT